MTAENKFLTSEQQRVLSELDRLVDMGARPKRTYLGSTNYRIFMTVVRKKKKGAALDDIDLVDDVYRGIKILPSSKIYAR